MTRRLNCLNFSLSLDVFLYLSSTLSLFLLLLAYLINLLIYLLMAPVPFPDVNIFQTLTATPEGYKDNVNCIYFQGSQLSSLSFV